MVARPRLGCWSTPEATWKGDGARGLSEPEELGDVVTGGPDGSGGLDLENTGGEMRMEFSNGVSAQ